MYRQCSSSFAWQRSSYKTLGPRNAGCPLSMKLIIMSSAMWCHSPFGLYVTIPSLIQAQDTTNARARIFSHNLEKFWNSQNTFLRFLFLSTQCRCTLTWRQLFLYIAQFHIEFQSSCFGSRWESALLWILGYFPLEFDRLPVESTQSILDIGMHS